MSDARDDYLPHGLVIRYSCKACGIKRAETLVTYRERGADIVDWMKQAVEPVLAYDHLERSPDCDTDQLSEVMIPVPPGIHGIGERITQ